MNSDSQVDLSKLSLVDHLFVWLSSRYRDRPVAREAVMPVTQTPAKKLRGLSFSVPELTLARCWSQASSLRMVIRLDHGSDADQFEEVLAFHIRDSSLCGWIMWRNKDAVFVQPLIGRIQRYCSVAEAFEAWIRQPVVLTDIKAAIWPI
jgi:hypothetical protein